MMRMTIRDIRLHWPEAEQALSRGAEVVVTRDGRPVARLLPYEALATAVRERFDAGAHMAWLSRFWKTRTSGPSTDELLARDRAE